MNQEPHVGVGQNGVGASALTPFEYLGLPARFDLSREQLDRAHRELAKTLHPDRHRDRPASERRLLLERAMKVNEAYRLLRDPVKRALALLEILGHPHDLEKQASPPPEFLMDVMEEREGLAEAAAYKDAARVSALIEAVAARHARTERALTEVLGAAEIELAQVLPLIATLRYDARFLEEARSLAEDL